MLTSDFYVRHTTSHAGTRYDDLFSKSFGEQIDRNHSDMACSLTMCAVVKSNQHPYRSCTLPTDVFHLPTVDTSIPLPFAYCRPLKGSQDTLQASGSMLGLAPSKHLRQIDTTFLLHQLLKEGVVQRPIFSLMLISGNEGVLSIGGTGAQAAEMVSKQTADQLDRAGAQEKINAFTAENGKTLEGGTNSLVKANTPEEKIILHERSEAKARQSDWKEGWTWSKVQGAEGWWQTLMQGVWVGGSRVLQNQAAVIDVRFSLRQMWTHKSIALPGQRMGPTRPISRH